MPPDPHPTPEALPGARAGASPGASRPGRLARARAKLRRARAKLREVGPAYAVALLVARLVPARLFRVSRLVLLALEPRALGEPAARLEGARWARSDELELLAAFGHPPALLRGRFAAGDRAFALERGGALGAYVWFHAGHHDEGDAGVRFALAEGDIWLFDAMVAPALRGRGLYPALLRAAATELEREGLRRIWIASDAANRNSLRAHEAAGARPVARLLCLRLLGFTLLREPGGLRLGGPSTRDGVEVRLPAAPRAPAS